MDETEIPEVILNPPDKYDKICNNPNKSGYKPNLLVNGNPKLYITHVRELIVDGSLSDREYTNKYCQYKSFDGVIHSESQEKYVEFLRAVWQAIEYINEYEEEINLLENRD